jgi:hypothetical protein
MMTTHDDDGNCLMKSMTTTVGRGAAVSVLKIELSVAAAAGGADKQQSIKVQRKRRGRR